MDSSADTQLQSIDRATLTPLVRQALGSERAEVVDWDAEQIHRSATAARIYRLSGTARDRDDVMPWNEWATWAFYVFEGPEEVAMEFADRVNLRPSVVR